MSEPETTPQGAKPKITAAGLMAACDEVEVACHPTEYKRAAAARARGEGALANVTAKYPGGGPGQFVRVSVILEDLEALAAALKVGG